MSDNFDTVMPMYTHTQPAQPSTLSHYLLSVYDVLTRNVTRLLAAEKSINRSPLGAAAITTTGFNIDRQLTSELLGFDEILENSYDCIAAADHTLEFAGVILNLGTDMSRFIKDLLDWCTKEYGFVYLADGYVQKSSIMPQKRNPSSFEHCRPLISKSISQAQAVFTIMHNTPYGDIVDSEEELQEHLYDAVSYLTRALDVMSNVLGTMDVNKPLMLQRSNENFITVTELADTLVREFNMPFRKAHSITATIVKELYSQGLDTKDITQDFVNNATYKAVGAHLEVDASIIRKALDPTYFVWVRKIDGGPSPSVTKSMYKNRVKVFLEENEKCQNLINKYNNSSKKLNSTVQQIIEG